MKKRNAKMFLATALCAAMMANTAFATTTQEATTASGTTITGDSTVEAPQFKVVIPTTLAFGVDPFNKKGDGQIYSAEFPMINKSDVNVRVDCSATVKGADGKNVVIKNSESDVTETGTDKLVYMAIQIPSVVEEATAANAKLAEDLYIDESDSDAYYGKATAPATATAANATNMVKFAGTDVTAVAGTYSGGVATSANASLKASGATKVSFALKKADYLTYYTKADKSETSTMYKGVAANQDGSTVFRFTGKVNSKANWGAGDLKATMTYNFSGLGDETYTGIVTDDIKTNAHAYIQKAVTPASISAGATAAAGQEWQYTAAFTKGTALDMTVNFGTEATKITAVEASTTNTNADYTSVPNFLSASGNKATILAAAWPGASAGDTRMIRISLDDGSAIVVKVTVQ